MTIAVQTNMPVEQAIEGTSGDWASGDAASGLEPALADPSTGAPSGWRDLRDNPDIQFEEIQMAPPEPQEPSWLLEVVGAIIEFLFTLLAPLGQALGFSWPALQWILLAGLVIFVLFLLYRFIGPLAGRNAKTKSTRDDPEWQPDEQESLALLEDADRLAAEGRFDEATHLLLKRSVGQIAKARPDWVEPSSTARELAALPALSDKARAAFAVISSRVERSLFALSALNREDWEAARSAYANFALAKIEGGRIDGPSGSSSAQARAL